MWRTQPRSSIPVSVMSRCCSPHALPNTTFLIAVLGKCKGMDRYEVRNLWTTQDPSLESEHKYR